MELLLRVLIGIAEVFLDEGDFENLIVDFVGKTFVLIGDCSEVFSMLDLKIGFTFKGVFHADSDSVEDLGGSSAESLISGVLEGLFDNVDNFGWICSRGLILVLEGSSASSSILISVGELVGFCTGGSIEDSRGTGGRASAICSDLGIMGTGIGFVVGSSEFGSSAK